MATRASVIRAERKEARLVAAYVDHLEGDVVSGYRIPVRDGGSIFCDIYNQTRRQLIEAKVASSRNAIRMAIGQLADYGRFLPGAEKAILLEASPSRDLLDLLAQEGITAIWRVGDGFEDTSGGRFV